jgi:SAM-dependent methyltransferase
MIFSKVCGSPRHPTILHPQWLFIREYLETLFAQKELVQGHVLDVGSGDRYFEQAFRDQYMQYIALDYPKTRRELVRLEPWQLPDVAGDGRQLPLIGETFDTVFLFEVLEHCPEPAQMLSEIYTVLKSGGVLLLTVPLTIPEHAQPHDYYRYTQFGLRYLLEQAGFSVEQIEPIGKVGTIVAYHLNYALMEGTFSRGSKFGRLLKLLFSPLLLLVWLTMNLVGGLLNRFLPNPGFVLGYGVVARKKPN